MYRITWVVRVLQNETSSTVRKGHSRLPVESRKGENPNPSSAIASPNIIHSTLLSKKSKPPRKEVNHMGRTHQKKGAHTKVKKYKKTRDTKRRRRDVDQVFDDVARIDKEGEAKVEYDEDLPGGGQFYCVETGKHFTSADALKAHRKSRAFRRRVKELKEETKYTQAEADFGAGMTKEILPKVNESRMRD